MCCETLGGNDIHIHTAVCGLFGKLFLWYELYVQREYLCATHPNYAKEFFTCIREDIESEDIAEADMHKEWFFYLLSYFMEYESFFAKERDMLDTVAAFTNKDTLRFIMKNLIIFSETKVYLCIQLY